MIRCSTNTVAVKHVPKTPCSPIVAAFPGKASIVALALVAAVAGCETAPPPPLAEIDPATGQTHVLTPQEWGQRNFPGQGGLPASSPSPLTNGLPRANGSPNLPSEPAASQPASSDAQPAKPGQLLLRESDVLRISFPGSPMLNTVQQIRRDGNISLQLVGEFKAAGRTTSQVEKELLKLYDAHLQVKEVSVAVETSTFAVYVTGSVLRPGKIMSDRPMSAMEAIVEAGIDHAKANLKKVRVIRQENGRTEYHILNLRQTLLGKPAESFDLKPSDIIYVPERFALF